MWRKQEASELASTFDALTFYLRCLHTLHFLFNVTLWLEVFAQKPEIQGEIQKKGEWSGQKNARKVQTHTKGRGSLISTFKVFKSHSTTNSILPK